MKKIFLAFLFSFIFINFTYAAEETVRIYGLTGDGFVKTSPYPGSWDVQRYDTNGRSADYEGETAYFKTGTSQYYYSGYFGFVRAFVAFDTSVIPDNAEILDASLNLYVTQSQADYNDDYGYFSVLEGRQSTSSRVLNSDIDDCGDSIDNPTKGSEDIDIDSVAENEYKTISLNRDGVGWISTDGHTKFCMREGHDIDNQYVTHPGGLIWQESWIHFKTADAPGTTTDPYLEITYTVPDEEKDFGELVDELTDTVEMEVDDKAVKNSYLAHVKKLVKFLMK